MQNLQPLAKNLRKNSTDTENKLWFHLRSKRFEGLKFRRQQPLGPYIVDFVCLEKRLVIECDGSQHIADADRDQVRDAWMQKEGFKVLRFWDGDVLKNIDEVLEIIFEACGVSTRPLTPSPRGRGDEE